MIGRPYIEDYAKDQIPEDRWQLPLFKRTCRAASLAVGGAMVIATAAALVGFGWWVGLGDESLLAAGRASHFCRAP
jgi:hypothetical protein